MRDKAWIVMAPRPWGDPVQWPLTVAESEVEARAVAAKVPGAELFFVTRAMNMWAVDDLLRGITANKFRQMSAERGWTPTDDDVELFTAGSGQAMREVLKRQGFPQGVPHVEDVPGADA